MKKIKVEEIDLFYLMPGDESSLLDNPPIKIEDLDRLLKPELFNPNDFRVILVITPFYFNRATLNYLYWNNGQDLKELDVKVAENNFTENDFKASVITRYQKTRCSNCETWWDTLRIIEDNYFRTPGLSTTKVRQSNFIECPNCGASLRQLVVKIF